MTKIVLAYELLEQGISKASIAERLKVSRRTVIRWAQAIEQHGSLEAYLDHYHQAKQGARRKSKRLTLCSNAASGPCEKSTITAVVKRSNTFWKKSTIWR